MASLGSYAFQGCSSLINLYIPATVTSLNSCCITGCSGLTACVYLNSAADTYAGNNNITAWYMDNYALQGIEICSLPEQTVVTQEGIDLTGLYVTQSGGRVLQLDDYDVSYARVSANSVLVTVSSQGYSTNFTLQAEDEQTPLTVSASTANSKLSLTVTKGSVASPAVPAQIIAAVYDSDNRLLAATTKTLISADSADLTGSGTPQYLPYSGTITQ